MTAALRFEPGDPVVRLVGLDGYEKGFLYRVAYITAYIKGEMSDLDYVHLDGVDIRYHQDGSPVHLSPRDGSRLAPLHQVPVHVRIMQP